MLTFTVEELIRFLSNWTMTFFEGAKRSGDIVFSRYYSFFKRPVLVREHQVESLYVMVQNRDSSDNKKPSFSRFAKWEFGGFIVDSKTIYMASKPVKALLQSSDFIDDMDVFEKLDSIRIPLFRKNIPADPAMFQDMFNNISFTANPTSSSDAIVLFLANQSEWAKEYVEKMLEEQEWSLKHIRRQVSIERYKEQKLAEYKKAPNEDLIQAKLFHDSVPKSGQVKVTLDIGGKQFVGSFDSKFFGYTGANLDEAILPEAGFKYPDSFEGYYEFLKDNGINVECKDGMFPFAFVKEIAAFRGDKIFWKREA